MSELNVVPAADVFEAAKALHVERLESLQADLANVTSLLEFLVKGDGDGMPEKVERLRLEHALAFIRYVADMDNVFYRRPNDWHVGLHMTKRAKEFLEDDARTVKDAQRRAEFASQPRTTKTVAP